MSRHNYKPPTAADLSISAEGMVVFCRIGCCPGCQDCYGMSLGCHQDPCRCELPCTCDYANEDEDPKWRDGCERHDCSEDGRFIEDEPIEPDVPGWCQICESPPPCSEDEEGRPLFHSGVSL